MKKIVKLESYNPESKSDAVLRDDFRIALGWLSTIDSGTEFKYTKKQILPKLAGIVKEMIRRGMHLHPVEMKKNSKKYVFYVLGKIFKKSIKYDIAGKVFSRNLSVLILNRKVRPGAYWLDDGKRVYGLLRIDKPKRINFDDFVALSKKHGWTEEAFNKSFLKSANIIAYQADPVFQFSIPRKFRVVGSGKVVREIKFIDFSNEEIAKAMVNGNPNVIYDEVSSYQDVDSQDLVKSFSTIVRSKPDGEDELEDIELEDVIQHLNDFQVKSPFIYLVGSIAYEGKTSRDIDVLIRAKEIPDEFWIPLIFRFVRQFPHSMWNRFHFILDDYHGPFTDYVELYDLGCRRMPWQFVREMSDQSQLDKAKAEIRAHNPRSQQTAQKAEHSDKITLGEFFFPLKTSISAIDAYREGEIFNFGELKQHLLKWGNGKIPKVVIQKKYD